MFLTGLAFASRGVPELRVDSGMPPVHSHDLGWRLAEWAPDPLPKGSGAAAHLATWVTPWPQAPWAGPRNLMDQVGYSTTHVATIYPSAELIGRQEAIADALGQFAAGSRKHQARPIAYRARKRREHLAKIISQAQDSAADLGFGVADPKRPQGADLAIRCLSASAIAKYTMTCGGSFPSDRFAPRPHATTTSSITSRGTDEASTPSEIWSAQRAPAATPAFCVIRRDHAGQQARRHATTRPEQDQLTVSGIAPRARN